MDSVTINLKTDRWNLTSIDLVSGENVQTKRVESYEQSFPNGTHFPTPCDTLTHDWIKAVKTAPTELMVVTQENTASTPRTAYVRIEGTVGLNVSEMLTVTQNGAK